MVTTVFDKTQVWPRKSILSVKSYPDLAVNHLKLIRDNFKIFLLCDEVPAGDSPVNLGIQAGALLAPFAVEASLPLRQLSWSDQLICSIFIFGAKVL